jgi:lipopolysaccharide export system protein LptC
MGSAMPKQPETSEIGRTGGYLAVVSRRGERQVPTPGGMARRRWMITATKYLLPTVSLLLLATIAVWPEMERATDHARLVMNSLHATVDGARVLNARYNGVDEHGRPYTVTARTATQRDADRIDMTTPNADMTLENGTWINVKSNQGVYTRKARQLDMWGEVVLYRDDGTTMTTASATVDMEPGAASGAELTHIEGPFGTIDATGFTTVDKGAAIQFWGPARANLNGVSR